jgi:CRP/FNR family transcriptional regulator, anaerobic regulatory protein
MSAMTASPAAASGLAGISLFEGMPEAELIRAGLHASARALTPGEDLFAEGEPRARFWFLRSGWVRMRVHSLGGHEATAVILGPGELCAIAPFQNETYACTVTALTEAVAVGVPAAAFEALLQRDPRAALRLAACMAERVFEIAQLKAINSERAALRLTLTLSWLVRKIGPRLPATRALLADLTGLRAETCSRALSGLRKKGLVRVSPRVVHVLQPAKLEALAARK